MKNHNNNLIFINNKKLWENFGFIPNLDISLYQNVKRIKLLRTKDNIEQPTNKAFHNLCDGHTQPPEGAADVLGLGLNYCIETPYPHQGQKFDEPLQKLHRSLRLLAHFDGINTIDDGTNDDEYDPSLYVPKRDWTPKEKNSTIESKFFKFSKSLLAKYHNLPTTKRYNLTSHNRFCVRDLVLRTDLIKGFTDKNLGPFIMPRVDYMQQMLNEHLL